MSFPKEIEMAFDEFGDGGPEVDRHGVDRSADAEGQRVDDAYERMVQQQIKDDLNRGPLMPGRGSYPNACKWCRMPNGQHHPDCVVTLDAARNAGKAKRLTTTEQLAIAMEAEILKAAMKMEYEMDLRETMIWKIDHGTEVFVSDNAGVLRGHRMKKDAVYSQLQIMVPKNNTAMAFLYPMTGMGNQISTNLKTLVDAGWIVIETGLSRWPYLIIREKHAIAVSASLDGFVGRSGGTCRKLGY